MVTILKYMIIGILLYILIIPILEQLATLICQGLETLKGMLIYRQALIQDKIDNLGKEEEVATKVIGFSIPNDIEEEEEDEDEIL